MSTTRSKFVPIVISLAFGFAACGDDSKSADTTAPDTTAATETSATDATDTSVDDSGGDVVVMLADSSLGTILVDSAGMTLYVFANDPTDTATCTGGCASTWPPLLVDGEVKVGEGLDDSNFVLVAGEGGQQLSGFGHPLYYYAGDSAPGDVNGDGVGGVWFVAKFLT